MRYARLPARSMWWTRTWKTSTRSTKKVWKLRLRWCQTTLQKTLEVIGKRNFRRKLSIQWWQILLLTLYSAYQIWDELTIVSISRLTSLCWFHYRTCHGGFRTGLFIGASSIDSARWKFSVELRYWRNIWPFLNFAFQYAKALNQKLRFQLLPFQAASPDCWYPWSNEYYCLTTVMRRSNALIIKGIERNYLLGAVPGLLLVPFQSLALAFGGFFCPICWLCCKISMVCKRDPGGHLLLVLVLLSVSRYLRNVTFTILPLVLAWRSDVDSALQQCSKCCAAISAYAWNRCVCKNLKRTNGCLFTNNFK